MRFGDWCDRLFVADAASVGADASCVRHDSRGQLPVDEPQLTLDSGLKTLDFAAIVFYFVLTFGIALWFGRKQKDVDDFFVGGRRMPWFAVGLSILATLFSTLSYLGMPGEMI